MSDVRGQMTDERSRKSEALRERGKMDDGTREDGGQRSEDGSRKSEGGKQKKLRRLEIEKMSLSER